MPTLKLTDAQRVVLAAAGARDTGLVLPLPKSLAANKLAASRVLQSLMAKALIEERPAKSGEEIWKNEPDDRTTLQISSAGLAAIGIEAGDGTTTEPAPKRKAQSVRAKVGKKAKGKSTATARSASAKPSPSEPKATTKLGQLIAALRGKKGATIDELTKTIGWQAHSVRGAMSGALKRKLGLNVESAASEDRGRVYRIVG